MALNSLLAGTEPAMLIDLLLCVEGVMSLLSLFVLVCSSMLAVMCSPV